jgi:hypothetical protein
MKHNKHEIKDSDTIGTIKEQPKNIKKKDVHAAELPWWTQD